MKHWALLLLSLGALVSADITVELFSDDGCGGDIGVSLGKVSSNGNNDKDSSGCQPGAPFGSVRVNSGDPGFQCNLFSDNTCTSFTKTVFSNTVGCTGVSGSSLVCFSQALFDNPFAESQVTVNLGTIIHSEQDNNPVSLPQLFAKACSSGGCDPTNTIAVKFDVEGKQGTITASADGSFGNLDQAKYTQSLLMAAMPKINIRPDNLGTTDTSGNPPTVFDLPNFARVTIRDKKGDMQAYLKVTYKVEGSDTNEIDCGGLFAGVTEAALKAVPEVGGLLASAFQCACNEVASGSCGGSSGSKRSIAGHTSRVL
ncbi:hypothetical protein LTR84_003781 [Exophiala bonariae]|uniref:Uncharacterized protein n=1 Tax=Exophiala bonariae TaxID=1690606 RepID=A0AAV9N676_9EURO|nr:hypothetical protein LTR84_003781 [Exophiala bonariae]